MTAASDQFDDDRPEHRKEPPVHLSADARPPARSRLAEQVWGCAADPVAPDAETCTDRTSADRPSDETRIAPPQPSSIDYGSATWTPECSCVLGGAATRAAAEEQRWSSVEQMEAPG